MKDLALALLWLFSRPDDYRVMAGDLVEDSRDSWEMLAQALRSLGPLLAAMAARGEMARALLGGTAIVVAPLALGEIFWTFVYSEIPLKEDLVRGPAVWLSIGVVIAFGQTVAAVAAGSRMCAWISMLGLLLAVPVARSFPAQPPEWFWWGLTALGAAGWLLARKSSTEVRR